MFLKKPLKIKIKKMKQEMEKLLNKLGILDLCSMNLKKFRYFLIFNNYKFLFYEVVEIYFNNLLLKKYPIIHFFFNL